MYTSTVLLPVSSPQAYRLSSSWARVRIWFLWLSRSRSRANSRAERDRLAVPADPLAGRFEHHAGVLQARRGAAAGAANQGAQACLQFEQIEGFGQVVVGAGVEPGDLVGAAVARRENQYRQRIAAFAQVLQQPQTIALRQAEVENAGLIGVVEQCQACGFSVTYPVDGVVGQLQAGTYAVTKQVIVFHQQYPH